MTSNRRMLAALAALPLILAACGADTPTARPTPTPSQTESASPSPTAETTPSVSATASGSSSPTAAADAPQGFKRIAVDADGFSVAVPEGWQELSADVLADEAFLEELRAANPDAVAVLEQGQAALESGNIALFAFDPDVGESEFATNLNVINVGTVAGTAEQAAEQVAAAVEEQVPITGPVESETTTLPSGEAAVVRYEWEVAGAGDADPTPVTVVQYAILADSGSGFILSLSAGTEDLAPYEEAFTQIAESFRESDE